MPVLTTVGKTDSGTATTSSTADKIAVSEFAASSGGTLTAGHWRAWLSAAGSTTAKMVVYADSGGSPGALLATSDALTITATTEGVLDFVFSGAQQITLNASASYWLGVTWDDPGTPSIIYSRDETSSARIERSDITYGTPPNPFGTATGTFSGPMAVWVDLNGTTSGGGTATTPTVRNAQTAGKSSTASGSISVTKPTGLVAGDYLLGISVGDADITLASMTGPSGFASLSSQAGNATSNYPPIKIFGKVADSTDAAASSFSFGFTSVGDGVTILAAITAGTFDTAAPVAVGPFTTTPRTSTVSQTAPSMTGVASGLLVDIFGTDTNNTAESYPTSGPAGFTRLATVQGTPHYAMAGAYYKALTAAGATGAASVSPTGAGTTNGWTTTAVMVNPKVTGGSGGGGGGGGTPPPTAGYTLIATVNAPTTTYLDTSVAVASGQTLGVGGIPTPAAGPGVVLITADSSSRLNISTSNRVYDGQGHTVGGITINADNVTVQNFRIQDATRDGVSIMGANCTVQNCSIVRISSDGSDINGITLFGDGHKILYNEAGVSDFMATGSIGGSHTDFVQTWNTSSKRSTSNLTIQGNRIVGPGTGDARFIHQGVQGEGEGSTDGGGGGSGTSSGWLIADNKFEASSVNQILNFLDIHDVDITRNTFVGSSSKIVGTGDGSTGIVFYNDNVTSGFSGTVPSTTAGPGPDGPAKPGSGTTGEPVAYAYIVTAVDAAGNESGGNPGGGQTGPPDTEAPTVPTNFAASTNDGRITLTWDPSTDNVGVAKYRIRRGGVQRTDVPTTRYVDIDLVNETSYSYTVSALDAAGNESAQTSPVSATATGVPLSGAPFLPGRLTNGKIEVQIAWGADLAADETTWIWADITPDVRQHPGISTALGRNDESSTSNPAELTVVLDNASNDYSLGTISAFYPDVRRGTPVRVRIDPGDGVGGRIVFQGNSVGFTPGWDSLKGTVPVVTLTAAGTLRRLAQGSAPLQSVYRRAMTAAPNVVAYWPFEDGKSSTVAYPVKGGSVMALNPPALLLPGVTPGSPDWQADSSFDCSAPLPRLGRAFFAADVDAYADTGASQVRFLLSVPSDGLPDGTVFIHVVMTGGTLLRWDITYQTVNGVESLGLFRYNTDGSLNSSDIVRFNVNGVPGRVSLDWTQSGSNIVWTLSFTPALATGATSAQYFRKTLPGKTAGIVSHFDINSHSADIGATIGHLTVENQITSLFTDADALVAYSGEVGAASASGRLVRLCAENGIPLQRYLGATYSLTALDQMGPQLSGTLLDALRNCEVANQGQLWDGRSAGLQYTTRKRRELGTVKLTVDASAGQLAGGFTPIDDDQRDRNKVTVTRVHGATYTAEDTSGAKGTAAIGIYDDAVTVNNYDDDSIVDFADWFVLLGTVEGYRYPSVTVDLAASPTLAPAVLDIIPGERIDVTNLDTTLAGFPDSTVSLIVEGIAHEITTRTWRATFRCSPYGPWATGLGGAGPPTGLIDAGLIDSSTIG